MNWETLTTAHIDNCQEWFEKAKKACLFNEDLPIDSIFYMIFMISCSKKIVDVNALKEFLSKHIGETNLELSDSFDKELL